MRKLFLLVLVSGLLIVAPVQAENDSTAVDITLTAVAPASSSDFAASALGEKLKGKILLAVEKRGEAYYVTDNGTRIYLKDGNTAYQIMRDLSLGISEADFNKTVAGDVKLKEKLKGKIILRAENKGEAYYVRPTDAELLYLKNGNEAFKVMSEEGLGISNDNIAQIPEKTVVEYKQEIITLKEKIKALQEEADTLRAELKKTKEAVISDKKIENTETKKVEKVEKAKKIEKTETTINSISSAGNLSLSVATSGGTVKLTWETSSDLSAPLGFKVVKAAHENPVYPGDDYHYLSDTAARSDVWEGLKVGTYFFRVCQYLGGKCGVYSDNFKVVIPE